MKMLYSKFLYVISNISITAPASVIDNHHYRLLLVLLLAFKISLSV